MITRNELVKFLDDYLTCSNYVDYAPNGLQIEGNEVIRTICTAVTASQDAIEKSIEKKADALIVHHGYFWRGEDPIIIGMKRKRIGQLLIHNLNLLAFHLPLDCHPDIGNNAQIGLRLNVQNIQSHCVGKTPNLLWTGELSQPHSSAELNEKLNHLFQRSPLTISIGDKPISKIAWCSGAAQDYIEEAFYLGAEAYLSGEVSERTYYQANELNIHYFACGHHATERFGIQALGEVLSQKFSLIHHFIDTDNPV